MLRRDEHPGYGLPRRYRGSYVVGYAPRRGRAVRATIRGVGKATAWAGRASYRRRYGLAPFYVLVALAALVAAARKWPAEFGARGALGVLVAAGLFIGWRHWCAHRSRRSTRWSIPTMVHTWGSWVAATAWTLAVGGAGWSLGAVFWIVAPWLVSAGRYWWLLFSPDAEPVDESTERDRVAARWQDRIAADGKKLPGSYLVGVEPIDRDWSAGWEADVEVDDSRHTTDDVIAAGAQIAAAWAVPLTSVLVTAAASGAMNLARIRVFKRNPLHEMQVFDGPTVDVETGRFVIGMHADRSLAYWRLWTPGSGAVHGMIAGTTGSGKSAFATLLAIEALASRRVVVCVGDTENGESVPALQEDVHCFTGTVDNIRDMLLGLVAVGRRRRQQRSNTRSESGQRGKGFFEPTAAEPLWLAILEEPSLAMEDPIIARCVKEIGTKFRKYGVAVVVDPQVPSLGELGNDLAIRSMLAGGNVVIFRTGDRMSGTMATPVELTIDPSKLPESWPDGSTTAGLGMVANEAGRTKPMRTRFVADPYSWVKQLEKIQPPQDDVDAFNVASRGLWNDWLARLDDEPEIDTNDPLAALIAGGRPAPANVGSVVAGVTAEPSKRDQILAYLRERGTPCTTGTIAKAVDAKLSTVSTTCARLAEEERLVKVARGVWQDPQAHAAQREATERLIAEGDAA